jgi:hypothetical protein
LGALARVAEGIDGLSMLEAEVEPPGSAKVATAMSEVVLRSDGSEVVIVRLSQVAQI